MSTRIHTYINVYIYIYIYTCTNSCFRGFFFQTRCSCSVARTSLHVLVESGAIFDRKITPVVCTTRTFESTKKKYRDQEIRRDWKPWNPPRQNWWWILGRIYVKISRTDISRYIFLFMVYRQMQQSFLIERSYSFPISWLEKQEWHAWPVAYNKVASSSDGGNFRNLGYKGGQTC